MDGKTETKGGGQDETEIVVEFGSKMDVEVDTQSINVENDGRR